MGGSGSSNGGLHNATELPVLGARPLESLASQSQPILGSGNNSSNSPIDPYASEASNVIVKEKKKKSDKKKEQ